MSKRLRNLFQFNQPSPAEKQTWRQKIEPVSGRAFELARERWQRNAPLDEKEIAEANRLREQLLAFAEELTRRPALHREMASQISEGLLDTAYAISAPPATSLRLHHFIESRA